MSTTAVQREVKERPILFSAPMIKAILEGRKTQTRRVIKPQPTPSDLIERTKRVVGTLADDLFDASVRLEYPALCLYGWEGDRLRVRETFYAFGKYQYTGKLTDTGKPEVEFLDLTLQSNFKYQYAADTTLSKPPSRYELGWHKRPAIFMPREASRLTLEIRDVRVERLQSIPAADIVAEGVGAAWWPESNLRAQWGKGWDAINKARGYGWETNCWVWVITFNDGT